MKRYLSVFEMIARSSIYNVLLVLIGMAAVQVIPFYLKVSEGWIHSFESYINESSFDISFKMAYVLITILVILPGMNLGSVQGYTLQRLRIKERRVFCMQALYNFFAYVLLWGMELFVLLVCAMIHNQELADDGLWNNQTLFLAFYKNEFMHTILPLEDALGWFAIITIVITSGLVSAEFTRRQRCGKYSWELGLVVVAVIMSIPRGIGDDLRFLLAMCAIVYLVLGTRWVTNRFGGEQS